MQSFGKVPTADFINIGPILHHFEAEYWFNTFATCCKVAASVREVKSDESGEGCTKVLSVTVNIPGGLIAGAGEITPA